MLLFVCGRKANYPLVGPGPVGGEPSVGIFLRDPNHYLREFRRNSERVGHQARLEIELDTSLLKVLSAGLLRHWWVLNKRKLKMKFFFSVAFFLFLTVFRYEVTVTTCIS